MKRFLAIILGVLVLALAGYVGIALLFVGGIAQIVDGVTSTPVNGEDIGYGALRMVGAGLGTVAVLFVGMFAPYQLWQSASRDAMQKRRQARLGRGPGGVVRASDLAAMKRRRL